MVTRIAMAVLALMAAFLAMRSAGAGRDDGDFYCHVLRQGWSCMYARANCESRLALERPEDVEKRCSRPSTETPSP